MIILDAGPEHVQLIANLQPHFDVVEKRHVMGAPYLFCYFNGGLSGQVIAPLDLLNQPGRDVASITADLLQMKSDQIETAALWRAQGRKFITPDSSSKTE